MQIGEVAAATELSIRTIRHYDELGLVTPSARSTGGFRLYTVRDVERLLVIRRMKPLGFTLAEMKDLLEAVAVLEEAASAPADRIDAIAKVREFQAKTDESAHRLRRHLSYADEFATLLASRADA